MNDYLKIFYVDTAIHGHTSGFMYGYAFFGVEHILFATDMPADSQGVDYSIKETIAGVKRIDISEGDKEKIFESNVRKIFRLPA